MTVNGVGREGKPDGKELCHRIKKNGDRVRFVWERSGTLYIGKSKENKVLCHVLMFPETANGKREGGRRVPDESRVWARRTRLEYYWCRGSRNCRKPDSTEKLKRENESIGPKREQAGEYVREGNDEQKMCSGREIETSFGQLLGGDTRGRKRFQKYKRWRKEERDQKRKGAAFKVEERLKERGF